MNLADGRLAEAALGHIDDALEGEVVGLLRDHAEIGHGIADFGTLVKARAADDAVVEAKRDEPVFELAHLERGADQDGHVVQPVLLLALHCSISSPTARASSSESQAAWTMTFSWSGSSFSVNSVFAEPAFIVGNQVGGGTEDMLGRAIVALQLDDGSAGEVLFEAQDVVHLGAAPAVDRLVVIADTADVDR